jgi:hypothetical protein
MLTAIKPADTIRVLQLAARPPRLLRRTLWAHAKTPAGNFKLVRITEKSEKLPKHRSNSDNRNEIHHSPTLRETSDEQVWYKYDDTFSQHMPFWQVWNSTKTWRRPGAISDPNDLHHIILVQCDHVLAVYCTKLTSAMRNILCVPLWRKPIQNELQ